MCLGTGACIAGLPWPRITCVWRALVFGVLEVVQHWSQRRQVESRVLEKACPSWALHLQPISSTWLVL